MADDRRQQYSGSDDARSEDNSEAVRRGETSRIANEGINENGGAPVSSQEMAKRNGAYSMWETEGRPNGKYDKH